ncbi:MAG: hypothetical protein KKB34_12625 [Bacteroidetes bacterium]|nr:hypothetical protein [Bacteroidota bacterium]
MRKFDKKFFEFPLCLLSYNDPKIIDKIISYSIVKYSQKVKIEVENRANMCVGIYDGHFDWDKKEDLQLIIASKELGIKLSTLSYSRKCYQELNNYVEYFVKMHGNDAWCRIGNSLLFETRDKRFAEQDFRILCAIQSDLGKQKKFSRIVLDKIRYRMYGYKSKDIYNSINEDHYKLLTDKQLRSRIDKLHAKQFYSKFTYRRRQTFYSTRLDDEELQEAVGNSKLFWAKKKMNFEDTMISDKIYDKIQNLKLEKSKIKSDSRRKLEAQFRNNK